MTTCFFNNVYLCFLPVHISHDFQPLNNNVFNTFKVIYWKELIKLNTLTNSTPMDKINFIYYYIKIRKKDITKKTI